MAYREAEVIVKDVGVGRLSTKVLLEFCRQPDGAPIAPGAIYKEPASGDWTFELHKLVHRSNLLLTFETYGTALTPPVKGESYFFRSWWTRAAAEAVLDQAADWVQRAYSGDHEHCLITWETILAGQKGMFCARHGWISNDAYQKHVVEDRYRLRGTKDWKSL